MTKMKFPDKTKEVEENIYKLFQKVTSLKKVLTVLNKNGIRYGIFAGAHVFLLTSNREPTDVDILVADADFGKLADIFKGNTVTKDKDGARSSLFYIDEDSALEFVARLDFTNEGKVYPIRLTPLAWEHSLKFSVDGTEVILLNPVDTLLEKAILPRGEDVGKHDLEDIGALMNGWDVDKKYLKKRVVEMGAEKQVAKTLQNFNIL